MLWTRVNELLDCVVTALEVQGRDWTGEMPYVASGSQLVDDYCCPGQLSARILRTYPSNPFPQKTTALRNCGFEFAAHVTVSIIRCSTGVDRLDQKKPPRPDQIHGDAEEMVCDMAALKYAIECCYTGDYVVDQIAPLTGLGGCYGSELSVWLAAGPTCDLPELP